MNSTLNEDDGTRTTNWETAADGFGVLKSLAFNNDGSEVYLSDTLVQQVNAFTWDRDAKKLTRKDDPYVSKGRPNNLKSVEGTDHVIAGNIENFIGNINFEL